MPREFLIPTEQGRYRLRAPTEITAESAQQIFDSGETPEGFVIQPEPVVPPPSLGARVVSGAKAVGEQAMDIGRAGLEAGSAGASAIGDYLSKLSGVVTEGIPAAARTFVASQTAPTFGQEMARRAITPEPVFGGPPQAPSIAEQIFSGPLSPVPGLLTAGEQLTRLPVSFGKAVGELADPIARPLVEAVAANLPFLGVRGPAAALAGDVRALRGPRFRFPLPVGRDVLSGDPFTRGLGPRPSAGRPFTEPPPNLPGRAIPPEMEQLVRRPIEPPPRPVPTAAEVAQTRAGIDVTAPAERPSAILDAFERPFTVPLRSRGTPPPPAPPPPEAPPRPLPTAADLARQRAGMAPTPHPLDIPPAADRGAILNESGEAGRISGVTAVRAGLGGIGAVVGGTQGDTPGERLRNAAVLGVAGYAAPSLRSVPSLIRRGLRGSPPPPPATTMASETEILELFGDEPSHLQRMRESLGRGLGKNYGYDPKAITLTRRRRGAQGVLAEEARKGQRAMLTEAGEAGITADDLGVALKGLGGTPEAQAITQPWRARIDRNSTDLVARGLLDPKIAQAHMGEYARRVYLRDVLGAEHDPIPATVDAARTYLRANLLVQGRAASEAEIEGTIRSLLTPKRTTNLSLRGSPRMDISPLKRRHDIPAPLRALMGEIEDGAYLAARTVLDQENLLINDHFFRAFRAGAEDMTTAGGQRVRVPWVRGTTAPGYTEMPESRAYGALRGQFVLSKHAEDIVALGRAEPASIAERIYFDYINAFKYAKVILNPATWVRNITGNFGFADFAGVAPWNPLNTPYYLRALRGLARGIDDPLFREAIEANAIGVEMVGSDVRAFGNSLLHTARQHGVMGALRHAAFDTANTAGRFYNAQDRLFRLAGFAKQRAIGRTADEAANHINTWFPTYTEVGEWVKELRGSERTTRGMLLAAVGNPFASYKAEALRIAFQAAREHPVKLAKWLTLPAMVSTAGMAAMGVEPEEVREAFRRLPSYLQQPFTTLVPWRTDEGDLQFFDATYMHFLGDVVAANPRAPGLEPLLGADDPVTATMGALAASFSGGSPFAASVLALASNTDMFRGHAITEFPITTGEGLRDVSGFLAKKVLPVPPLMTSLPPALSRSMAGEPVRLGQHLTPPEVLREQVGGLRVVPVDQDLRSTSAVRLQGRLNALQRRLYGAAMESDSARREARMAAIYDEIAGEIERQQRTTAEMLALPPVFGR